MQSILAGLLASALLAGCASFSDSGLVAGKSTGADVEAMFGRPAERVVTPDGGSVLYYPRGPQGRTTYAVVLGAEGRLQAIEQRLTDENIAKITVGTTTAQQVRELLGPSLIHSSLPRLGRDVWEYKMGDRALPYVLWVQFSADGIAREVIKMTDELDRGSDRGHGHGHGRR